MIQLKFSLLLIMFAAGSNMKAKAQASFQLSTDAAAPGSTIVLKYNIEGKYNPADLAVFFENEQALLLRSDNDSTLIVMVPQSMPGNCKLFLSLQGIKIAADLFTIEAVTTQRILLDYANNKFKLLSRADAVRDDNIDNIAADNVMVFEVMDGSGKMISSGAFENPNFSDYESFGSNNKIGREKPSNRPQHIPIIIPKGKGINTISFFEVQQPVRGLRYSQITQNAEIMKTRKQVDQISFEN